MDISFAQKRYLLASLKFNTTYNYQTVQQALVNENWVSWADDYPMGHDNPGWSKRFRIKELQSPILKEIQSYLHSEIARDRLLDVLYSFSPAFQGLWSITKEQMKDWATFHMEYVLDKPGFYLEPHNDYRRLVGAGMLYLNEMNDPRIATTLYTDRQLSDPLTMPTNFGDGWFAVNDYCNWHEGANSSDYDRYSILLGLTIKSPEEYVK